MDFTLIMRAVGQSYLGKAFGLISVTQAMNAVTSFGIMTLYTKVLPPQDYGKISLIWLFITILSILVDTRLNTAFCIRFYKIPHEESVRNIYTILMYNLLAVLALYAVLASFPQLVQSLMHIVITAHEINLVCLITFLMVLVNFLNSLLMVSRKPKGYFFIMLLFNTTLLAASALFLLGLQFGYVAYLYSYLAAYGVVSLVSLWYLLTRYRPTVGGLLSTTGLKGLLRLSLPLVPDGLLLMFMTWAGRYLLNLYSGLAVVGVYSVAYMFSNIFNNFIVAPFAQAVTPMLFEKYVASKEDYKRFLGIIFKYYWLVVLTIVIAYFVVLQELFSVFVGARYVGAYNIIAIIMLGIMFSGAVNLLGATIIMREKTKRTFMITAVSVVANITLNLLLVPQMGMYGAALAMLLSYALQFALVLAYTQRLLPVRYNYGFVCRYGLLALAVAGFVLAVSYLAIPIYVKVLLKLSLFGIYMAVIVKTSGLRESLTEMFRTASVPAPR